MIIWHESTCTWKHWNRPVKSLIWMIPHDDTLSVNWRTPFLSALPIGYLPSRILIFLQRLWPSIEVGGWVRHTIPSPSTELLFCPWIMMLLHWIYTAMCSHTTPLCCSFIMSLLHIFLGISVTMSLYLSLYEFI